MLAQTHPPTFAQRVAIAGLLLPSKATGTSFESTAHRLPCTWSIRDARFEYSQENGPPMLACTRSVRSSHRSRGKKASVGNTYTPPPGWMACMAAQTPPQSAAARNVRIWSNGLVPCNPMHAMVPANPPTPAPAIGSAPSMPSAAQVAPLYTAMKVPNPPAWDLHSCHSRSLGASLRATSNVHSVPTCHDAAGASTAMSARSTRHAPGATSADVPPLPRADAPPRRAGTRPPPARRMEDVCRSPPCLFVRGKSRSS